MSYISTFGSYTQARLGIYASYAGLTVTGNNISNINTEGYTRQKLNQTSFYAGSSDRYASKYSLRIGYGTLCTGVSQLRDPYLDIRYRNEASKVGGMDTKLSVLEQIEHVLDEVGDGEEGFGIIADQLSDLYNQLSGLNDQTGQEEYDILVRSSAETLTNLFRSYAAQLEEVYENTESTFKEDMKVVNNILSNIQALNENIRKAEIHGSNALELRDERNMLIDELAGYTAIDVVYTEEDIGAGVTVEHLNIYMAGSTTKLVDGIYARQLSLTQQEDPDTGEMVDSPNFDITLSALTDAKGRLQYTLEQTGQTNTTAYPGTPSTSTTQADGTILITTYTKTNLTGPRQDADGNYLDADGNIVADAADAQTVPVYLAKTYTKTPSTSIDLEDNDLSGSLQALREMLTEEGEFTSPETLAYDPDAASKRGIPYYQQVLDLFANKIAAVFNEANQGWVYNQNGNYIAEDGTELLLAGEAISTSGLTAAQQTKLAEYGAAQGWTETETDDLLAKYLDQNGYPLGTVLFSNNGNGNSTEGITASNISISADWASGPQLVRSFEYNYDLGIASTDGSNILHMMALMDTDMTYDPRVIAPDAASESMFKGSFSEMWNQIGSTLGKDMDTTTTLLDTYYAKAVELDTSRDSVSSVDLNDEAMNLMQYSQSYNAACRLMTTIDSVLDKLINGTGITL